MVLTTIGKCHDELANILGSISASDQVINDNNEATVNSNGFDNILSKLMNAKEFCLFGAILF